MMTLRELIKAGIEFEGYRKVQCWENEDYPKIYHEGNDFKGMPEEYLDRMVRYIFPYQESDSVPGITIELYEASNGMYTPGTEKPEAPKCRIEKDPDGGAPAEQEGEVICGTQLRPLL